MNSPAALEPCPATGLPTGWSASAEFRENLLTGDRWVAWHPKGSDKVPLSPRTGRQVSGPHAGWGGTFEQARKLEKERGFKNQLGYVLLHEAGLFCIDLDDCRNPWTGETQRRAWAVINRFPGAYCEKSPSGRGIHVWLRANIPPIGLHPGDVGFYNDRQYITVTHREIGGTGFDMLRDWTDEVLEYLKELAGQHEQVREWYEREVLRIEPTLQVKVSGGSQSGEEDDFTRVDCQRVLQAALSARNGQLHGTLMYGDWKQLTKTVQLEDGSTKTVQRFKYESHALMSLCGRYKYWINRECGVESDEPEAIQATIDLTATSTIYKDLVRKRGKSKAFDMLRKAAERAKVLRDYHDDRTGQAEATLNRLMETFADDGIPDVLRPVQLVKALGISRSSAHRGLEALKKKELIEKVSRGKYAWTPAGLAEIERRVRAFRGAKEQVVIGRREFLRSGNMRSGSPVARTPTADGTSVSTNIHLPPMFTTGHSTQAHYDSSSHPARDEARLPTADELRQRMFTFEPVRLSDSYDLPSWDLRDRAFYVVIQYFGAPVPPRTAEERIQDRRESPIRYRFFDLLVEGDFRGAAQVLRPFLNRKNREAKRRAEKAAEEERRRAERKRPPTDLVLDFRNPNRGNRRNSITVKRAVEKYGVREEWVRWWLEPVGKEAPFERMVKNEKKGWEGEITIWTKLYDEDDVIAITRTSRYRRLKEKRLKRHVQGFVKQYGENAKSRIQTYYRLIGEDDTDALRHLASIA